MSQFAPKILGFGELTLLLVSAGFDNAKDQGLKFPQMTVTNGQVDAETVPGIGVAVPEVHSEAGLEAAGEANIVEFVATVERVDALPIPDVPADDSLILLEGVAGDVLQMLTDELAPSWHR